MKVSAEQGIGSIDGVSENIDRLQVGVAGGRRSIEVLKAIVVIPVVAGLIFRQEVDQECGANPTIGVNKQLHFRWEEDRFHGPVGLDELGRSGLTCLLPVTVQQ